MEREGEMERQKDGDGKSKERKIEKDGDTIIQYR